MSSNCLSEGKSERKGEGERSVNHALRSTCEVHFSCVLFLSLV